MKFLPAVILALCVAPGANAFMPLTTAPLLPPTKLIKSSAIFSSSADYLNSMGSQPPPEPNGENTPPSSGAAGEGDPMENLDAAMATRLASLEQKEAELAAQLQEAESRLADKRPSRPTVGGALPPVVREPLNVGNARDITDYFISRPCTTVQGGSTLRTWSFANPAVEMVQVYMKTEGRPLDADVQLWQGPDNTPCKMKVYLEDGGARTFHALIATPHDPNTIAIRNTGMLEFPLLALVEPDGREGLSSAEGLMEEATSRGTTELIQGGALRTYPFDTHVNSVAILLQTDGRPLNARVELLQGPNNNKQVVELYTEDGMLRPWFGIVETPGSGNVVRVVNTAPVEFPMTVCVAPYGIADAATVEAWGVDGMQLGKGW